MPPTLRAELLVARLVGLSNVVRMISAASSRNTPLDLLNAASNLDEATSTFREGCPVLSAILLHVLAKMRMRYKGDLRRMVYKWKNHFYEMKGDVRMSLHEKERNKKMPTPRHKITHNPIPTSLFCFNMLFVCLFVCSFVRYECIRQSKQQNILTSNFLRNMLCCGLGRHKDVGMGL